MADTYRKARSFLGTRYKWGGDCPDGVDCSGLVKNVYPSLPRTAREQRKATAQVAQPSPGDLAFLRRTQKALPPDAASHVGIVTDRGTIIHASSKAGKVVEVPLSHFSGSRNFYGYGRPGKALAMAQTTKPKSTSPTPLSAKPTNARGAAVPPAVRRNRYDPIATGDLDLYLDAVADVANAPRPQPEMPNSLRERARTNYLSDHINAVQRPSVELPALSLPERPVRREVPLPERPSTSEGFGTPAAIVTALMSLFGGPGVGAAGLSGARVASERDYADRSYRQQFAQSRADTEYSDASNAYEDTRRQALVDRGLLHQQNVQSADDQYNLMRELLGLQAEGAGQDAYAQGLNEFSSQEQGLRQRQSLADSIRQEIEQRRLMSDQGIADEAAYLKEQQDAAEHTARMRQYDLNRTSREDIATDNRNARTDAMWQTHLDRVRGQDLAAKARARSDETARMRITNARTTINSDELKDADVKFAYQRWMVTERALASAKRDFMTSDDPQIIGTLETDTKNAWAMLENARGLYRQKSATGQAPTGFVGSGMGRGQAGVPQATSQTAKPRTPSEVPGTQKPRPRTATPKTTADALYEKYRVR